MNAPSAATIGGWINMLAANTREFATLFLDDKGTIIAWEAAAELLFGYTREEAIGMPFSQLFIPDDVARSLDVQERELALRGGRSEDDRWHVRKNGSWFWGSGVMEPIRNAAGETVALAKTVRDRTDVRSQVETLKNRLAEAERVNQERLLFLASLAHELRNQLSPLSLSVEILAQMADRPPPPRTLKTMRDKALVMSNLLNDLADASREEALRPRMNFEPVNVQAALAKATEAMADTIASRHQVLRLTVPETIITLQADPIRLDQILMNLLTNASKFSPEKGEIQVSATVEADAVAMRVEDNGYGIAPDVLPKIFDLFTRETPESGPEGLGVGLAVVKELAALHSGFIEARSPGRNNGSVFTLRLPLTQKRVPG